MKNLHLWEAYHQNKLWLKAVIDYQNWQILETNIPASAEFILKTLKMFSHFLQLHSKTILLTI
jgi:hypothetical protein